MTESMFGTLIGAIGGVLASLVGAVLASWLGYRFQAKLLDRQMELQKLMMEDQKAFQAKLLEREIQEARHQEFLRRAEGR